MKAPLQTLSFIDENAREDAGHAGGQQDRGDVLSFCLDHVVKAGDGFRDIAEPMVMQL